MNYLPSPNLPGGRVTDALISEAAGEDILSALISRGVRPVKVGICGTLPREVASHADMIYHHLGSNRIISLDKNNIADSSLHNIGFKIKYQNRSDIKATYPRDAALDAARIGDRLICNEKSVSRTLVAELGETVGIISVKQGYAKCSVCIVTEHSLITSDTGIAEACEKQGIDVLRIRCGFIELPGYDYGFLGGCSGKLASDIMAFSGNLAMHPDFIRIKDFLKKYGVTAVSLGAGPLRDIGGIIPLTEE